MNIANAMRTKANKVASVKKRARDAVYKEFIGTVYDSIDKDALLGRYSLLIQIPANINDSDVVTDLSSEGFHAIVQYPKRVLIDWESDK